jgi:hypothetical protein
MQALTILTQRNALLSRHNVHVPAQRPPYNYKKAAVSWLASAPGRPGSSRCEGVPLLHLLVVLKARLIEKRAFQIANLVFVEKAGSREMKKKRKSKLSLLVWLVKCFIWYSARQKRIIAKLG